jgi:transposase-like protein
MVCSEGLKQSLLCRYCGKRFIEIQYSQAFKAFEERVSLRGIQRLFGVRRQTVAEWIKKSH